MGVLGTTARYIGAQVTGDDSWSVEHALGMSEWLEHNPLSAVVTLMVFCVMGLYLYLNARNVSE